MLLLFLSIVGVDWGYSYNRGPTFFLYRGPARGKSGPEYRRRKKQRSKQRKLQLIKNHKGTGLTSRILKFSSVRMWSTRHDRRPEYGKSQSISAVTNQSIQSINQPTQSIDQSIDRSHPSINQSNQIETNKIKAINRLISQSVENG